MARTPEARKREIYAHHEASHAVAALALDAQVDRVTIEPSAEDSSGGHVAYRRGALDPFSFGPRNLIISLSGPAGQRKHAPRSNVAYNGAVDFEQARDIAKMFSSSPTAADSLYRWADGEARKLVEREWPKIELVANALLERRTLNGDELRAVVAPIVESQGEAITAIRKIVDENPGTRAALLDEADARWRQMKPVRRSDVAAAMLRVMTDALAIGTTMDFERVRFCVLYQLVAAGFDEEKSREKLDALIAARAPHVGWKPVAGRIAAAGHPGPGGDLMQSPLGRLIHGEQQDDARS